MSDEPKPTMQEAMAKIEKIQAGMRPTDGSNTQKYIEEVRSGATVQPNIAALVAELRRLNAASADFNGGRLTDYEEACIRIAPVLCQAWEEAQNSKITDVLAGKAADARAKLAAAEQRIALLSGLLREVPGPHDYLARQGLYRRIDAALSQE